ncbi:MAG: hypothetical protein Ct9H90mP1_1720 [Methanobacteriota archaeon]|nr:MAG: hypothetical protein Ct9H90mP1_1720 [Euryarchaeota archaeon]
MSWERICDNPTGSVWDASGAQFVIDEGADMVGVARVAIAHSSGRPA